jgi:hypothetical protein
LATQLKDQERYLSAICDIHASHTHLCFLVVVDRSKDVIR